MLWSFAAFIIGTFLIYWATYPITLYALGATLVGTFVFLYHAHNKNWTGLNLKNSIWIPVYLAGMIFLSYIGGTPTGGLNIIAYPYDYVVVLIYSMIFYIIALNSAPKEKIIESTALED